MSDQSYTCPTCLTSGLSAAELRESEVADEWLELPAEMFDDLLPDEFQGAIHGGVRLVRTKTACLYCEAQN